jgi:hypothetical protein
MTVGVYAKFRVEDAMSVDAPIPVVVTLTETFEVFDTMAEDRIGVPAIYTGVPTATTY